MKPTLPVMDAQRVREWVRYLQTGDPFEITLTYERPRALLPAMSHSHEMEIVNSEICEWAMAQTYEEHLRCGAAEFCTNPDCSGHSFGPYSEIPG